MSVRIGDTVHIVSWDTLYGHSVEEYKILAIAADHIELEHTATYPNRVKLPGSHAAEQLSHDYLNYFAIPLRERLLAHKESIDWLTEQLLST